MKEIRMIAEWESCKCVLLALPAPHTDWNYILEEAQEQYRRLVGALTGAGINCVVLTPSKEYGSELLKDCDQDKMTLIECKYNDTWTRDYGPISVERGERLRALDFGFNGWGLKFAADRDNLVNLHLKEKFIILPDAYRNERDFILEGGSVESDGAGTILTTSECLQSPNRNGGKSKGELNEILASRLGADHVLWLDYGHLAGDDTDSHIDTLCRMAPGNCILFTGCRNMDDEHFEDLLKMRAQLTLFRTPEGEPYNLIELPFPDAIYDEEGERLPATYANYLVTPTHIFMPTYGQPANDELACRMVKVAFPEHEVIGVDCTTLIKQHGSLHCATMQIPAGIFNEAMFD
ncbi:MAG: agmatine deiminase family protein [Muribaculaceae bacterium]|nr:agmatine deiminase family protein [Muribaculaceae bacterium]